MLKVLPKIAKAAQLRALEAAFEKHRQQTEGHVERLTQVFEIINKRAQGKTCPAISIADAVVDNAACNHTSIKQLLRECVA